MEAVKRKKGSSVLCRQKQGDLEYLTFPSLTETGMVEHLFSTRLGGTSKGMFRSMNLSYSRGDNEEAVNENYRRIGAILNRNIGEMVVSRQTHTTNVLRVGREDMGKGITKPAGWDNVDGLVTDEAGIVLVTLYADCVPLFFLDPARRAIGLSHSGWRGTVARMGQATVEKMSLEYGSRPEDILAAIGPSICGRCYEVGREVAEAFEKEFGETIEPQIVTRNTFGSWQLDLWEANKQVLLDAGILQEHISVTDICTCCNPDYLFSHRASGGKRGNLGAFLSLR